MPGPLWTRPISVTQNQDDTFFWGYATGTVVSSTPMSFAGASAVLTVRESSDETSPLLVQKTSAASQIVFTTVTVDGVTLGGPQCSFSNADTKDLLPGVYFYSLTSTSAGLNTVLASGSFTVNPSVW